MAYSNSLTQINLVLFIISLLFPTPSYATNSSSLIQQACSTSEAETKLCIQVLESEPHVRSATNFSDLCKNTMDSAIANMTSVHTHILDLLKEKKEPNVTEGLKICESGYKYTLESFRRGVVEIRAGGLDDPDETLSYDLYVSRDGIQTCQNAAASRKIGDEIILRGNKIAVIFWGSVIHLVNDFLSK